MRNNYIKGSTEGKKREEKEEEECKWVDTSKEATAPQSAGSREKDGGAIKFQKFYLCYTFLAKSQGPSSDMEPTEMLGILVVEEAATCIEGRRQRVS